MLAALPVEDTEPRFVLLAAVLWVIFGGAGLGGAAPLAGFCVPFAPLDPAGDEAGDAEEGEAAEVDAGLDADVGVGLDAAPTADVDVAAAVGDGVEDDVLALGETASVGDNAVLLTPGALPALPLSLPATALLFFAATGLPGAVAPSCAAVDGKDDWALGCVARCAVALSLFPGDGAGRRTVGRDSTTVSTCTSLKSFCVAPVPPKIYALSSKHTMACAKRASGTFPSAGTSDHLLVASCLKQKREEGERTDRLSGRYARQGRNALCSFLRVLLISSFGFVAFSLLVPSAMTGK